MNGLMLTLGYVLPMSVASLLTFAFGRGGRRDRAFRVLGLAIVAFLLGVTLALARGGAVRSVAVAVGPSFDSDVASPLPPRLAAAAAVAVLALVVTGLWSATSANSRGALLLAGAVALPMVLDDVTSALPVLWAVLLIIEGASQLTEATPDRSAWSSGSAFRLIAVGAPLLWLGEQFPASTVVPSAGLVLVGLATAGLWPFSSDGGRTASAITDGLLPVVGYVLAARGALAAPSAAAAGLVAALALLTIGLTLRDARRPAGAGRRAVAFGRVVVAGAFLLLLGVAIRAGETAAAAGLSMLVAGGIVAVLGGMGEARPGEGPTEDARGVAMAQGAEGPRDLPGRPARAIAERLAAALADVEDRSALALGVAVVLIAGFIGST